MAHNYIFAMSFFNFRYPFYKSSGRFKEGTRPSFFVEIFTRLDVKLMPKIVYFEICTYIGTPLPLQSVYSQPDCIVPVHRLGVWDGLFKGGGGGAF